MSAEEQQPETEDMVRLATQADLDKLKGRRCWRRILDPAPLQAAEQSRPEFVFGRPLTAEDDVVLAKFEACKEAAIAARHAAGFADPDWCLAVDVELQKLAARQLAQNDWP